MAAITSTAARMGNSRIYQLSAQTGLNRTSLEAQSLIFSNTHKVTGSTGELVVNLPNLMDHAQVQAVEGNQVIVAVGQKIYLDKLSEPTRLAWVERAISRVTDSHLLVRYVLTDELEADNAQQSADFMDDPLIQEGLTLGGQIQESDD